MKNIKKQKRSRTQTCGGALVFRGGIENESDDEDGHSLRFAVQHSEAQMDMMPPLDSPRGSISPVDISFEYNENIDTEMVGFILKFKKILEKKLTQKDILVDSFY